MVGVSALNTLRFDPALCTGCGICVDVCPHGVFSRTNGASSRANSVSARSNGVSARIDRAVRVVRADDCMECGACQMNCAWGAVQVESGVGCAAAMIRAALLRKKEVTCGDDT